MGGRIRHHCTGLKGHEAATESIPGAHVWGGKGDEVHGFEGVEDAATVKEAREISRVQTTEAMA